MQRIQINGPSVQKWKQTNKWTDGRTDNADLNIPFVLHGRSKTNIITTSTDPF